MERLGKIHTKFIENMLALSKLDSNSYSIIPTIIFLSSTFVLLYQQFYQYISSSTQTRTRLYKHILFPCAFYYITRIWFLFLKFGRYIINTVDYYIEMTSVKEEIFVNQVLNHGLAFIFVLTVSIVPLLILCVLQLYRRDISDLWEDDDPWIPSEMGTSEQYLDRPARFVSPFYKNKNIAYRSGRSSSLDPDIFVNKQCLTFRPCKSLTALGVEELSVLETGDLEPSDLESSDDLTE